MGVLVDPRTQTVEVYRLGAVAVVLHHGDVFTVLELLSGWKMPVSDIWAPEFD